MADKTQKPTESPKSTSPVDSLQDGTIYIDAGNNTTNITNLGKQNSKEFVPHIGVIKSEMLTVFYAYKIKKDELPPKYKSTSEFANNMKAQSLNNEYIRNWVDLSATEMKKFLTKNGVLEEDVVAVGINNDTDIYNRFFLKLTNGVSARYDNIFTKEDVVDGSDLSLMKNTPSDVKDMLNKKIQTLNREDRDYSFADMNIPAKQQSFLNGLLTIDEKQISKIKNKKVVIVVDFFEKAQYIKNVVFQLEKYGADVLSAIAIARIF